jgi:radical SAM protein with 4Fe4S-binding SPASM domain
MGLISELLPIIRRDVEAELHHLRVKPIHSMGFLTYRCTSRCRTCTIWKRNPEDSSGELSRDEWLLVMGRLKLAGVRDFELFGGDALLRTDAVFDVIRFCSDNGMETFFPTNSISCDRQTVHKLIEAGLGTVYLSLDDIGEDNDGIRGVDGTFELVKKTLEAFVEERGVRTNPHIIICTTLSSLNFRNFPKLVDFLDAYPVNALYPRPLGEFTADNVVASGIDGLEPEPYFMPSDGQSHLLTPEQYVELNTLLARYKDRGHGVYVNLLAHYLATQATYTQGLYPPRKCHVATTLVTINPNGDVVPCPFFRAYAIGNLVRQELSGIWGNKRHRRFIKLQQSGKLPMCKNCNMRVYYPSLSEKSSFYLRRAIDKITR